MPESFKLFSLQSTLGFGHENIKPRLMPDAPLEHTVSVFKKTGTKSHLMDDWGLLIFVFHHC